MLKSLILLLLLGCSSSTSQKKYRVIISTVPNTLGEEQMIKRFQAAAKNIGWEMKSMVEAEQHLEEVSVFNPDFMLSLRYEVAPIPNLPSFLYIHQPMFWFTDKNGKFRKDSFAHFLNYDGFLQVNKEVVPIVDALNKEGRSYFFEKTVFSHPETKFVDTPKTRLCFYGALWEKARKSDFASVYKKLSDTGYFDAYGPKESWEPLHLKAYKGFIPMQEGALEKILTELGVVLILHSRGHFEQGIPTARIFEAAACSCVIISDKHAFIEEHFGDSVLYINRADPEEMFRQIDEHMKWILSHPKEAVEMARKAHTIFKEKFTLENELIKIGSFFERFKVSRKK